MQDQYSKLIKQLETQYKDLTPLLQTVCRLVETAIDANFAEGGRWDGKGTGLFSGGSQKWAPLAKSTQKSYEKKGWTTTATLNRHPSGLHSTVSASPFGKTGISVGANSEHAAIHQFGGTIEYPERESSAKWKASKNKNGNYQYQFAKKRAKGKSILERKFKIKAHSTKIPARPFITLTPKDIEGIITQLMSMLTKN